MKVSEKLSQDELLFLRVMSALGTHGGFGLYEVNATACAFTNTRVPVKNTREALGSLKQRGFVSNTAGGIQHGLFRITEEGVAVVNEFRRTVESIDPGAVKAFADILPAEDTGPGR